MVNRKKLANLDNARYKLSSNKTYIGENLSYMNKNIAFEERKLKRKGVIHACFKKYGVAYIKHGEHDESIKIHFN